MNRPAVLTVCALLVVAGAWQWANNRPVHQPPGILVPDPPRQTDGGGVAIQLEGYTLTPLARFEGQARVIGLSRYRLDRESDLAPYDLALAWGAMSDSRNLEAVRLSQSGRFLHWSWDERGPPIPAQELARSMTNVHVIPADDFITRRLAGLREGELVRFDGVLVAAQGDDGFNWRSSLTRDDTGQGACELLWLESLSVVQ